MTDIYPLLICGVMAVAGSCLLYVFVLDVRMKTLTRRNREQREHLEGRVTQVTEAAERLKAQLAEMEKPQRLPAQPLNLNKRGQILRMRRRGEPGGASTHSSHLCGHPADSELGLCHRSHEP